MIKANPQQIAAFSGGKDSTAMVLAMAEAGDAATLFYTPAGNEPPELDDHIEAIASRVGWPLIRPQAPTLFELIDRWEALPNWRQRWCTRAIKIQPCIAYLMKHPGSTLCVGLRADEEERQGLYGDHAAYRYPLREKGWTIRDVWDYLDCRGVRVPERTDCMLCFGQRLGEWYKLWRDRPDEYARGVELEARTGHTFRSSGRDKWPAGLEELSTEFEKRAPRSITREESRKAQLTLFGEPLDDELQACRVCRL